MDKFVDMDGNEVKVGDTVLFATTSKEIARAKIVSINDIGVLELRTLKNRRSKMFSKYVLLDQSKQAKGRYYENYS